jgi:hypothetical protein
MGLSEVVLSAPEGASEPGSSTTSTSIDAEAVDLEAPGADADDHFGCVVCALARDRDDPIAQ